MGTLNVHTFNTWQVELTTRCPLSCAMCIKDTYRNWHRMDMSMDNFLKILPYLRYVKNVVLEGWGESLMHPNIVDIVKLVKKQGCEVGFVTSGYGLDEIKVVKLTEAGIDFIGFSFSGGTSDTHNSIRVNSDFESLLQTVQLLTKKNPKKPKIHIVYLILKRNLHEMPAIVKIAKELNVKEVVFINITHITNKRQYEEKAFFYNDTMEPQKKLIDQIVKETNRAAKKYNVKIYLPNFYASEVAVCSENPLENLYISVDGEVSPCVYLYPPLEDGFIRIFSGMEYTTDKLTFGNIFFEDIGTIWNRMPYVEFRKRFMERKKKLTELYTHLFEQRRPVEIVFPEPPESCKTCHKILGL